MRKRLSRALLAAGTVTAALCLAVPVALAAGTWTITGGRNFTGVLSSGSTVTVTDVTKNLTFACTTGTIAGTFADQSMSTNTAIGSVTKLTFGDNTHKCTGPFGSTATFTLKAGTTATINAGSYSAPVTTGTITNLDLIMSASGILGNCTAEIKGTAGITFNNTTHLLAFTTAGDDLRVTSTTCSFFSVNDMITISTGNGGFVLTGSPVNPIQVSQP